MKALLQFSVSGRLKGRLLGIEEPKITVIDEDDDAAFAREIADTDILLHVLRPITAEMIAMAPQLKLIQKIGVGVNTIDLEAAQEAGVAVANMPGTNTVAVAEHTLALIFSTLRRIADFDSVTREGKGWDVNRDSVEAVGELSDSTIGLIGYGAVARRLSSLLRMLGAHVQYWNRRRYENASVPFVEFDTLLETSDIVSLHIPLTEGTRGVLDRQSLARMKPSAILINTARGELIDQNALTDALTEGRLGGAGLDVFEREPFVEVGALAACPNVVLTPHIAWLTPQTFERSIPVIVENTKRLSESVDLINRVV